MNKPLVSVIMPVYNAEGFLAEAIESILQQSLADLELIIINDGSTDKSLEIINRYATQDERIKIITRPNLGLVKTLNEGIRNAMGQYIARQDADDISLKSRLREQVKYLSSNPSIALVGSNYYRINEDGQIQSVTNVFTKPADLKVSMVFSNQFGHGTVMARKKELLSSGGYKENYKHAEDYELWTRISRRHDIANIKKPLYKWRINTRGVTLQHSGAMNKQLVRIRMREFAFFLGHRREYNLSYFRPHSTRGGLIKYLNKKNTLLRDLATMYTVFGLRRLSIPSLILAVISAPWVMLTYKQLFLTLFARTKAVKLRVETI